MDDTSDGTSPTPKQQSSTLSDSSVGSSSTVVASPTSLSSPTVHRPGYRRVSSIAEEDEALLMDSKSTDIENQGLGLTFLDSPKRISTSRVPVGSKSSPTESASVSGSPNPLVSPSFLKSGPSSYHHLRNLSGATGEDTVYRGSNTTFPQAFTVNSEYESLHKKSSSAAGLLASPSADGSGFSCTTKRPMQVGRSNWLYISILVLSVYSTALSGIWLIVAITKPRYSKQPPTAMSL